MKRKRDAREATSRKRLKHSPATEQQTRQSRVLALCYPSVLSLRDYLRRRLPQKSSRRKKLNTSLGQRADALLDGWRVGVFRDPSPDAQDALRKEFVTFTQTQSRQSQLQTNRTQTCSLEDVLGFVTWHLFNTCGKDGFSRPNNVICNGMQRGVAHEGMPIAPGIVQVHPTENLALLRSPAWTTVFAVLGADGQSIVASLLLECGLFTLLNAGEDNYFQVSGAPINGLKLGSRQHADTVAQSKTPCLHQNPSTITFVRNRMLYAKPSINAKGSIRFGLKHIHVLQRYANIAAYVETVHFLKHVFPRQFGLHNVFTSTVDRKTTTQPLLDYVYREDEIKAHDQHPPTWLPRRLRGPILELAQSIRRRHARCGYAQKLRHYCPPRSSQPDKPMIGNEKAAATQSGSSGLITQMSESRSLRCEELPASRYREHGQSFLTHATPTASAAAFCKSVIGHLLPSSTFGSGVDGKHNWKLVFGHIEDFIHMRRFESTTLHHLCQALRLRCISWLVPSGMSQSQRLSTQERAKRLQLLWEFMYYLFDSILIPLVQANFYVTESGTQRNRLFYFRHDVWRKMAEPSLSTLKSGVYQQLPPAQVRQMLNDRAFGYSHIRLLPKNEGARTITNLRRRMLSTIKGRRVLCSSINVQLSPVFGALSSERHADPERLGGAILSVSGLHERLTSFKKLLPQNSALYFAKVDVQSCFDSIPQKRLLSVVEDVLNSAAYRSSRYVEIRPAAEDQTRHRYVNIAAPANASAVFSVRKADDLSGHKAGRVFSEVGYQKVWPIQQLLDLLRQHLQKNVVKIGKKHYRQTQGIPQGSVLSSLLCSLFYTCFEQDHLGFLDPKTCLLVRLIDDFLLVTTDKVCARRFLKTMASPNAEYGIVVNPEKTLANFEVSIRGHKVPRHVNNDFPYCGVTINTTDLQLGKDRQKKDLVVAHGLTVDMTKKIGIAFRRKVRLSFVQQLHRMLMDDNLNQPWRRLLTLLEAFEESAMKMYSYVRSLPQVQQPSSVQLIQVIDELGRLGLKYGQLSKEKKKQESKNHLSRREIIWALSSAILHVFSRKQSRYGVVLKHVRLLKQQSGPGLNVNNSRLRQLLAQRDAIFVDYVY